MIACKHGHLDLAKYLITKGLEVNIIDKVKLLIYACGHGWLGIAKYLVEEKGANINAVNERRETALMIACRNGHLNVVRYLVKKKANINAVNKKRETILMIACIEGHLDVVRYLVEKVTDLSKPFYIACGIGSVEIVQAFLKTNKITKEEVETAQKFVLSKEKVEVKELLTQYQSQYNQVEWLVGGLMVFVAGLVITSLASKYGWFKGL
jgi:hypothetical protein